MGNVGPHADHVGVDVVEKNDVAGEILKRLPRQAHHHASPHLVPAAAQGAQALDAPVERTVRRMEHGVERGIGGLDAQEVARRTGGAPAAVRFLRLLAEAERHAEMQRGNRVEDVLDEPRVRLALDLARLDHDRPVARRGGEARARDDLLPRELVAGVISSFESR